MPKAGLNTAIPCGLNRGARDIYFFDLGDMLHVSKKGEYIDPFASGEFVDPKTLPDYDHSEVIPFQAGKPQILPYWDEDLLRAFVAREEFAKPGMEEKIKGWIKEGYESYDLIDLVRKENGLITLADVGLKPLNQPVEEENKSGG